MEVFSLSRIFGYWGCGSTKNKFNYYEIIAEKDLFIRANCFDIPISIVNKISCERLNIFEEKIIEFGLIQIFSTQVIAESLSVDFELIKLIQHKLLSKGYLTTNRSTNEFELSDKGINYFENKQNKISTEEKNFRCILPAVGNHLSYINYSDEIELYNQIAFNEYEERDYNTIVCKFTNSGNSFEREGVLIDRFDKHFEPKKRPSEREVRELIRKNKDLKSLQINNDVPINIPFKGEEIYFHYKLALVKTTGQIIVSNGYHFNDSELYSYVKYYYPTLFDELNKMANVNYNKSKKTTIDNANANKTSDTNQKQKSGTRLQKPREFVEGKSRHNIAFANNELLGDYYTAIELAFFKYLKINPVDDLILQDLAINGYDENANHIVKIYWDLFSQDVSRHSGLFKVSESNIENFKNDSLADMNALLPLLILQARDFSDSLFISLIKEKTDFIKFISRLKSFRNVNLHDGEEMISYDDIMYYYEYATRILEIILPSNVSVVKTRVSTMVENKRFNDVTFLSKKLGGDVYHRLDSYSQKKLLDIVMLFNYGDAFNFVNNVYSLFQRVLKNYVAQYLKVSELPFLTGKRFAVQFLNEQDMFNQKCPDSLSTVGDEMFKRATQLDKSSLGGYMLVVVNLAHRNINDDQFDDDVKFNVTSNTNEFHQIKEEVRKNNEKLKEICKFIDEILTLRFHGNAVTLSLSEERLSKIYDGIFNTILLIGEI